MIIKNSFIVLAFTTLFVFILVSFADMAIAGDNIKDTQSSVNKWELDKLSIIKKREVFDTKVDINNENIVEIANKFNYINDYYVYILMSLEKPFGSNHSPVLLEYLSSNPDIINGKDATLYFEKNDYASYAQAIKKITIELMKITNEDAKEITQVISIAANVGAIAYGQTIKKATIELMKVTSEYVKYVFPVFAIPDSIYYYANKKYAYAREKEAKLDELLSFFNIPMNKTWQKMILLYKSNQTEWGAYMKRVQSMYNTIQYDEQISPKNVLKFKGITLSNHQTHIQLDSMIRYYLFDLPIQHLSTITNLKIDAAKGVLNDNEEEMMDIGKVFSRSSRLINYTALQETREIYAETAKRFKDELSENELKELDSISKILPDWLKEPPNIQIKEQ